MKKLAGITVFILLISFSINAQQKQQRKGSNFTPEQTASLKVKQMTLNLELNASQQKEVYDLMKINAEERQSNRALRAGNRQNGAQLTSDQKFELQKTRLDKMIAHKAAMKTILSKDQFEKWEETMTSRKKMSQKSITKNNKKGMKGSGQKNRPNNNKI